MRFWTWASTTGLALVAAACLGSGGGGSGGSAGTGASGGGGGGGGSSGSSGVNGLEVTDKVDLVLMIDNSISMADKQQILTATVPRFVQRLASPKCLDGAGQPTGQIAPCDGGSTPEFEPITDLNVAVVSSSLGDHGGNVCAAASPADDKGHLIGEVRPGLPSHQGLGFLNWQAGGDTGQLVSDVAAHVTAAGETGCGFESQLESWFRFLVEPAPPSSVSVQDGATVTVRGRCAGPDGNPEPGADVTLCEQRKAFLRPDSLVAIVMLTDENDCSIRDSDIGWYVSTINNPNNTPFPLARATDACKTDPNGACCRSCLAAESAPPAGCTPLAQDPECSKNTPLDPNTEDKVNLRCWQQKRRFGIDFMYPLSRYVNALTRAHLCVSSPDLETTECPPADVVPNPLFTSLRGDTAPTRGSAMVKLMTIVGVPWQDLATDATLNDPNALELMNSAELAAAGRWDWITGDYGSPPGDPLMVESMSPRTGTNPATGAPLAPPSSGPLENPINGHEWDADQTQQGDLQHACSFPLPITRDCSTLTLGCDCKSSGDFFNSPLCQDPSSGAYSTIQHRAKAYPGLRHLAVVRDLGENGIPASICAKDVTDPQSSAYGYNAAFDALARAMAPHLITR